MSRYRVTDSPDQLLLTFTVESLCLQERILEFPVWVWRRPSGPWVRILSFEMSFLLADSSVGSSNLQLKAGCGSAHLKAGGLV